MLDDTNLKIFHHYLKEREAIRIRKEADDPWPWTDDKILQTYKFTNVKRENDRTSRELKKIYDQHRNTSYQSQLLNCGIYRYFGTYEFAQALGWQDDFNSKRIISLAKRRLAQGQRVFTGAYVITNQGISRPKEEVVVDIFIRGLHDNMDNLVDIARNEKSWQKLVEYMKNIKGWGGTGFMSKEFCLDAMMLPVLEDCEDKNIWTPVGPGSARGLNRLYRRPLKIKVSHRQALEELQEISERTNGYLPRHVPPLNFHDICFSLCELDKYMRVLNEEGRPRSRYKPRNA